MNTTTITALISLIGGIWTIFKVTGTYKTYVQGKFDKAIEALAAGVVETLHTYVWTKENSGENMTAVQAKEARELAVKMAVEIGTRNKIDVRRTLGDEFIDKYLSEQFDKLNK